MPESGQSLNVVVILADDLGFADLGCYGSRIHTPNLDALAASGVMMSQFYNTARCSPARASLLTGQHPHATGLGVLTGDDGPQGYPGSLNDRCVTLAEVLQPAGYTTAARGKWHLTGHLSEPHPAWPTRRGFDSFYGTLGGSASYYDPVTLTDGEEPTETAPGFYLTTEVGHRAEAFLRSHHDGVDGPDGGRGRSPFLLYLAFTAPHWPLHAPPELVRRYDGTFADGWDSLRVEHHRRQVESGLIRADWPLPDRDPEVPAWDEVSDQDWQARRMAVYAAQVEAMDAAIGRLVDTLDELGARDDTMVMFLSDNGGCAEEMATGWADELDPRPYSVPLRSPDGRRVRRGNDPTVEPGGPESFASYGRAWANASNAPFREYKHWVHEGGIATPFIVNWPAGGLRTGIVGEPCFLPDVMATVVEATGASYPTGSFTTAQGHHRAVPPMAGRSMLQAWRGGDPGPERELCFEHEGNAAIRRGRWKLVRKHASSWELYDLDRDRAETADLAGEHPELVAELGTAWQRWADANGVLPREQVLAAKSGGGR